jgi:DNA-binding HxlR family transcriptional regulator
MTIGKSGRKLAELINHAIDDGKITTAEYEQILHLADEDGHIDVHEKSLLRQLNELLADGTVKRTAK